MVLLPEKERKVVCMAIMEAMPGEGDTPVARIDNVFNACSLTLTPVSKKYLKKYGYPINLLQDRCCRMVARTRLMDDDDNILHFVAWDRKC